MTLLLESLDNWCTDKDLIINYTKTQYMILSKTKTDINDATLYVICKGHKIERVRQFKYLGIIFDETLTFNDHFNYVCKKLSSAIGCLSLLKRYVNIRCFKTLIHSFVFSIIDYGFTIWGKLSDTKFNILQSKIDSLLASYFFPQLHNKFQRLNKIAHHYENIHFQVENIDYYQLYEKCNLFTVKERLNYFYAVFVFKSLKFKHVPEISNRFSFGQSTRTRNLIIPSHNSNFYTKSPFYQSALVWNSLKIDSKQDNLSLTKFTNSVNEWILNQRNF